MSTNDGYLEQGATGDELIIFLHGFGRRSQRLRDIRAVTRRAKPNADLFAPDLPIARSFLCTVKAEHIVAGLMRDIDRLYQPERHQRIILVGHSFGAVLARKIAITAFGEQRAPNRDLAAPFEAELAEFSVPRRWATRIGRLVLLAGMNRGWTTSSALDWLTGLCWSAGQVIGELAFSGKPTIFALRRGAPFLVNTRLQWLALMSRDSGSRPDLLVIQLLGTKDDQVSPNDNVDFSVDLSHGANAQAYFYLEVPFSGHVDVVDMVETDDPARAEKNALRRAVYLTALLADRSRLSAESIERDLMADSLPPPPDHAVTDVVFVIHGIRDKGYWTQKIARTIKRHAPPGATFRSWTESYGYFAMLPFALRSVRQRKVEWFMDCYVEAKARYPQARLHYVGHSNGTYLCAQALMDYPTARFSRIVFAGSVVRSHYDWLSLIRPRQGLPRVDQVLNYVATKDWVVALLPNSVEPFPRFNLGGAGHNGFSQARPEGPVHQATYIKGGHSAGREEENWDDIARFIVSGVPPATDTKLFSKAQHWWWRGLGTLSTPLCMIVLSAVLGLGVWLASRIFVKCDKELACTPSSPDEALTFFLLVLAYATLLRLITTRL